MSDKAQELIDFAKANGLEIHGRTTPEEWAQELEKNGGGCPCKHADTCPCEDALELLQQDKPEDQACFCTFFVSPKYIAHYNAPAWKPGVKQVQPAKIVKKTTIPSIEVVKVKEVPDIPEETQINSQKTAEVYIQGLELIGKGRLEDFTSVVRMDEATNPCELCRDDADLVASHGDYVRALCSHDDPACEEELQKLIARTTRVIDEDLMNAGMARKQPEGEPKQYRAGWREFSVSTMADPLLEGRPQKYKMKIAGAIYRNEFPDIKSAMEAIPE